MKINEVARRSGITVRTLHYYDEIGLLKPSGITEAGYRIYDDTALHTLQQILFFKELDFPLQDIKKIMENPNYDMKETLIRQKELLLKKRNRLNGLIALADRTIKGENDMSFKQFDMTEIEAMKKKYAEEVEERWGETKAYAENEEKTKGYDKAQWKTLAVEGRMIIDEFAKNRHGKPDSKEAQALVEKWQAYITASYYHCTKDILSGLGQMYIGDQRFTRNIDKSGEGTAAFMAAAIEVYCRR